MPARGRAPAQGRGVERRRGPGRPARIGQRQIVDAAVALGLDGFTMQGIAARLGVSTPALYSHVAGRDEVLTLVRAELVERMRTFASDADDWRAWLVDFAATVRRHLAPSASVLAADLRGPATTLGLGVGERGLQLLIDRGMSPAEAGRAVWLVFRLALTAGPRPAAALAGLVDDTGSALGPDGAGHLPATLAVHDALAADPVHDTFDHDLQIVLDGIAARLGPPTRRSAVRASATAASDQGDTP